MERDIETLYKIMVTNLNLSDFYPKKASGDPENYPGERTDIARKQSAHIQAMAAAAASVRVSEALGRTGNSVNSAGADIRNALGGLGTSVFVGSLLIAAATYFSGPESHDAEVRCGVDFKTTAEEMTRQIGACEAMAAKLDGNTKLVIVPQQGVPKP